MQLSRTKFRKSFILSTKKWMKCFPRKNTVNSREKSGDITRGRGYSPVEAHWLSHGVKSMATQCQLLSRSESRRLQVLQPTKSLSSSSGSGSSRKWIFVFRSVTASRWSEPDSHCQSFRVTDMIRGQAPRNSHVGSGR